MKARGSPRQALGRFAENVVVGHLEALGYRIVERNVYLRVGEIDIVALQGTTAILIEVRARREGDLGSALWSLSRGKQRRMRLAAESYLARHPELSEEARIDLVAVSISRAGKVIDIQHVENAVDGSA